jgi:hypothetical protein
VGGVVVDDEQCKYVMGKIVELGKKVGAREEQLQIPFEFGKATAMCLLRRGGLQQ